MHSLLASADRLVLRCCCLRVCAQDVAAIAMQSLDLESLPSVASLGSFQPPASLVDLRISALPWQDLAPLASVTTLSGVLEISDNAALRRCACRF